MTQETFFVVGHDRQVTDMFKGKGYRHCLSPDSADMVVFTGGHDVTPLLYGEEVHDTTGFSLKRDLIETRLYRGLPRSKRKIGICRGGQFLNVMNGGSLFQHVDGHATGKQHQLWDIETNDWVEVTSTHHQMIRPTPDAKVLGLADEATYKCDGLTKYKMVQDNDFKDIEVVYYDYTNTLCFQPHPEYSHVPTHDYFFDVMSRVFDTNKEDE